MIPNNTLFQPNDPAFLSDPYPVYAQLHQQSPIFYDEASDMWYFASHRDVDAILRDRRFGRSILHLLSREELDMPPENPAYEPFEKLGRHSMFDMEPPEHTRLRSLVHKAFTPRRIQAMQATIEAIANDLLDQLIPQGEMDVLADFDRHRATFLRAQAIAREGFRRNNPVAVLSAMNPAAGQRDRASA